MNNPIDQIQTYYEDLTKTDKEIAIHIINYPRDVATQTLDELAKITDTSKSALSRFAQRIGYTGFTEFKYDMARFLVSYNGGTDEETQHDPIRMITKTYSDYILKLGETIDPDQISRIADLFASSENVMIFGVNRSGNSARQMKQRLTRIGFTNVSSEDDQVVIGDYLANATAKDTYIIFSTTDNTKFFTSRLKEYKDSKCRIIFITANPSLPFKKQCVEYVVVPRISKDSYASFLDDQAIFFVVIEILIEAIVEKVKK